MTQKKLRVLIAYSMWSNHTPTILEYLMALKQFSTFEVSYAHVTHDAALDFDLDSFDIVFNNYCARFVTDGLVSESYRQALNRFGGLKIIAVQDEYDQTNKLHAALRKYGFHVLLTCVPPEFWSRVYPRSELPDLELIHVLTGYMPEMAALSNVFITPLKDRPILIGYRGGYVGARYGRLAFDKTEIGRRMREICQARGIRQDIATDAQSRIYGGAWYDFIGNCRAVLGSESGSNVFDFDGSLDRKYRELEKERGSVSYEEFRLYTASIEKEFDMGQISPRIFEYAVMRTPMILFRGRYSGIIAPEVHYIQLEKDFSNVDAVLERLNDLPALEAMADRAYEHLVGSGRFGYRSFAQMLEAEIQKRYQGVVAEPRSDQKALTQHKSKKTRSAIASPIEGLREEILQEQPTPFPRFLMDFEHKLQLLALYKRIKVDTYLANSFASVVGYIRSSIEYIPGVRQAARYLWKRVFVRRN